MGLTKEEIKGTKGVWIVESANVQTENRLIANCVGNGVSITDEDKANAKLISSAHDLLEALIEAKELIDNLTKDKSPLLGKPTKNKINTAINKAMGK